VEWRQGEEAGVAFAPAGRAPAAPLLIDVAELSDRVRKLETEVTSLRRMLKRLKAEVAGDGDTEAA
jgi:hypothetical protein